MKLREPLIAALTVLVMSGCASNTPYFDQHVGLAVNAAKAQQALNPEASRNTDTVSGIGGTPANSAVGEYHKSFEAPAPTFQVIGGGGGR